jgi:hypothetical protein
VPLDAASCPDPELVAAARRSWDQALALGGAAATPRRLYWRRPAISLV